MYHRGFASLLVIFLVVAALVAGGVWYYASLGAKPLQPTGLLTTSSTDDITDTSRSNVPTSWGTYSDAQYGFSFNYPAADSLSEDTSTSPFYENFNLLEPISGEQMIIAVILPSSTYTTDQNSAFVTRDVEVWRDNTVGGITNCSSSYYGQASAMRIINGIPFHSYTDLVAGMSHPETSIVGYQTLRDGSCYSIRYTATQFSDIENETGRLPVVNNADEQLNQATYLQILNSFVFNRL